MMFEDKIMAQKNFFLKKYVLYLRNILKSVIKEIRFKNNDIEIKTTPNNIRAILYFLQNHTLCQYKQLIDIACSDVLGKERRFSINYLLLSLRYNARLNIVIKTNEVFIFTFNNNVISKRQLTRTRSLRFVWRFF